MRRAAYLPAVLIVPLATLYGLDSSKSQPTHFLITFLIGLVSAAVVVGISRSAATRRIGDLSNTKLEVGDGKLLWTSGMGKTVLDLTTVAALFVRKRGATVRSMELRLDDGRNIELQGYADMNGLLDAIRPSVPEDAIEIRKWFQV